MTQIAIVGAGAAGTTAAYRLRQALGAGAEITVFEREPRCGGRTRRIEFAGTQVEVGATQLHSSGRHIQALMALAGLKPGVAGAPAAGKDEVFGFWNGCRFTLTTKSSSPGLAVGLSRGYGPGSAVRVVGVVRRTAGKWSKIYDLQKSGALFLTPADLLSELGVGDLADVSLRHALARAGAKGDFISDVVGGITRNIFTQDASLNAFAGEVGLAGSGLSGGSLFALAEGNETLFARALAALDVELVTGAKVARVDAPDALSRPTSGNVTSPKRARHKGPGAVSVPVPGGRLSVTLKDKTKREFDAVVVAAPLELADIKVAGARRLYRPPARQYQEVHVTLVAGRPSPAYFGLGPRQRMPTQVFASNSTRTPFCSMGVTGTSELGPLWKVFTAARPLSDETLKRMFSEANAVTRFVWKGAYPVLTPETEGTPFLLAPGLYYANGFESAASTVELAAVAGYNVAGLALNQLRA